VGRLTNSIMKGKYHLDKELSNEAKDFIGGLLEVDHNKRLSVTQALNHSWM